MAAAQRPGEEYTFRIDKAPANANPALTQGPEMARVRELMYWNMDNTARSEWANLVTSRTTDEKAQLARYAFDNHWWDLSVQATIAGKLWDHLEERFPLAYRICSIATPAAKISRKVTRWRLPVRKAPEPESPFPGGCQRPDADYAGHGDAHGEDV